MNAATAHNHPLRLHLGCGETYLKGYINIDFPQSKHTTVNIKADEYKDLRALHYEEGSVEEVRNHHVLEHFSRGEAIGLLLNWRRWLKVGGVLMIETPDFEESVKGFLSAPRGEKSFFLRHVFGSHEAEWAVHYDGWFEEKYRYVLGELGFDIVKIVKLQNNMAPRMNYHFPALLDALTTHIPASLSDTLGVNRLPNILCVARNTEKKIDERKVAEQILSEYLVGKEKTNTTILSVWMHKVETIMRSRSD